MVIGVRPPIVTRSSAYFVPCAATSAPVRAFLSSVAMHTMRTWVALSHLIPSVTDSPSDDSITRLIAGFFPPPDEPSSSPLLQHTKESAHSSGITIQERIIFSFYRFYRL
ncbi:hypothetical protein [Alistipes dispar]|uniref:hypothetical protein n=1 Tax=Alistipes dispar TaxID=2585119 RepID=UPI002943F8B9|nr:hypothetical protein [Alistipes dispar]